LVTSLKNKKETRGNQERERKGRGGVQGENGFTEGNTTLPNTGGVWGRKGTQKQWGEAPASSTQVKIRKPFEKDTKQGDNGSGELGSQNESPRR